MITSAVLARPRRVPDRARRHRGATRRRPTPRSSAGTGTCACRSGSRTPTTCSPTWPPPSTRCSARSAPDGGRPPPYARSVPRRHVRLRPTPLPVAPGAAAPPEVAPQVPPGRPAPPAAASADAVDRAVRVGLAAVRTEVDVPESFPPHVVDAARAAASHVPTAAVDATHVPFVTIDPAGSMDLDQAVHIERRGEQVPATGCTTRSPTSPRGCPRAVPWTTRLAAGSSPSTPRTAAPRCTRPSCRRVPRACSPTVSAPRCGGSSTSMRTAC